MIIFTDLVSLYLHYEFMFLQVVVEEIALIVYHDLNLEIV